MSSINPYTSPSAPAGDVALPVDTNPHTLWKQILGLCVASISLLFLFRFVGIPIVLAGVFTFVDAWTAGIYKREDKKTFLNISPMGWGIAMEYLLILAYPLYLINRNKLKTRKGNIVFFVLTIIIGPLTVIVNTVQLVTLLHFGVGYLLWLAAAWLLLLTGSLEVRDATFSFFQ